MGAGIVRTGNLFIGSSFRPETSSHNNNEYVWARLSLQPAISSLRKKGRSRKEPTAFICPITSSSSKGPGGCCYQRQHGTWQQEEGHHSLLPRLQSCWVVMINRHYMLTWEEDIIFTRNIPTSMLEIWCWQSKTQGPNSAQTSSFFRAGKHPAHCWNKTLKSSMHDSNRRLNWEERQGSTEVSTADLALPNQCTQRLQLALTSCWLHLLPPSIYQLRTWAVLLLTQHVGLAAAGSQSPTLFHHSRIWMGARQPLPEPRLSLPSQC